MFAADNEPTIRALYQQTIYCCANVLVGMSW